MVAVEWLGFLDPIDTTTKPALGKSQRLLRIVNIGIPWTTFIEGHDNICPYRALDVHYSLRSEEVPRSIDVRLEGNTLLGYLPAMS